MHLFLTGATGLVGGALAGALLDRGHRLTALVRGEGRHVLDMDGRDRIAEMALVAGDLTALAALPDCAMVVHCAALTDFLAPAEQLEAVNVGGARALARLAAAAGVPMVHVSTAYVCGRADGVVTEAPACADRAFANGYEASKARAEIAVRESGAAHAFARPSIIVGRLSDGAIPRTDDFYKLFRLFGSPLLGAVPARQDAAFAIVPIDHVVAGIVAMVERFDAFAGRAAHLVAAEPYTLAGMLDVVADYPRAAPARIIPPGDYDPARLDRRTAAVHARIAHFFAYFATVPRFAGTVLAQAAGLSPPVIDEAALRRMVDHCIATGFLDWA